MRASQELITVLRHRSRARRTSPRRDASSAHALSMRALHRSANLRIGHIP